MEIWVGKNMGWEENAASRRNSRKVNALESNK